MDICESLYLVLNLEALEDFSKRFLVDANDELPCLGDFFGCGYQERERKGKTRRREIKTTEADFDALMENRLHSFMSPFSNKRTDQYGGSLYVLPFFLFRFVELTIDTSPFTILHSTRSPPSSENRMRLILEIAQVTRSLWPVDKPVFCRLSITDHHAAGEKNAAGEYISWGIEQSRIIVKELVKLGIDLVDCTSGGLDAEQVVKAEPGHNVSLLFCAGGGVWRSY